MLANTAHDEAIRQAIITWPKRKRRAAIAKRREGPKIARASEKIPAQKDVGVFEWQLDEVTCGLDCGVLSEDIGVSQLRNGQPNLHPPHQFLRPRKA